MKGLLGWDSLTLATVTSTETTVTSTEATATATAAELVAAVAAYQIPLLVSLCRE